MLEKLVLDSGPHYYVGERILRLSDPEGYRLKLYEICHILGLTFIDQNNRHQPYLNQVAKMPLDEFICHCEIVYDEISENLENVETSSDGRKTEALQA
jgi:hypothetical protein